MAITKNVLIVAGEASGDLHAANLVKAIKEIYPQVHFFGLGGRRLKEQGVNLHFDIVSLAVVGFFEILKNLGKFQIIFREILMRVDEIKPDLAILVDYPGFNLRLAAELKKRGVPIIYYISPQVWAWGEDRIDIIKKLIDRMIVVFKFEEELYKKNNMPVSFVGHPLIDIVNPKMDKQELFNKFSVDPNKFTFAILPGSREKEIRTLLPIMLDTAKLIYEKKPFCQFLILRSSSVKEEIFESITFRYKLPICIISDMTYDGLAASDFALVASGTATLETAILGIPMAILYKVSFPTWAYIRTKIRIPYIGLVNVVRQKKFIAEFVQYNAKPKRIADYVVGIINDPEKLKGIKLELSSLNSLLGEKGASLKAARIIADYL